MDDASEKAAFREKIESIGFGRRTGQTRTTLVPNAEKPGFAGAITEHWDGRQDAVAVPDTVHVKKKMETG